MQADRERTMVAGFRHLPGHHCGSTALRNLLAHHGVAISEEMAFGLGAGPCFYYFAGDGLSPSRFTNGRTGRLEESFLALTGAELSLRKEPDPEASWAIARASVEAGRPALLITDLYHLDHYGSSAHFPGHAVVLAGFDWDSAYLADTGFEALQRTSLEGLARARHEQHPFYPLAGHLVDLPPGRSIERDELTAAAPRAIERAARRMSEPELEGPEGLPALRRFASEVGDWPADVADARWSARFGYQVIERRGTGGGNFRPLYSRFLDEVGEAEGARLAAASGDAWSALAAELLSASEDGQPDSAAWGRASAAAAEVLEAEQRLWDALL